MTAVSSSAARRAVPGAIVLAMVWALVVALPALAAFPRPTLNDQGMVASAHAKATEAGVRILRQGGNAVDAAVATAFANSVVLPYSAGIGGGGFLLLRIAATGEVLALDFRERAPLAATRDMYLDEKGEVRPQASLEGHLSVAVPGTVAGLAEVHKRYGKLPWAAVVEPAIELAHQGFAVSELYAAHVAERGEKLKRYPASAAVFLKPDGTAFSRGELLVQRDLAATLRRLQKDPNDFYRGRTAELLVLDMAESGGLITRDDLAAYRPTWRKPVCGTYREHRVCSMPPPSSGGVHLVQMLNMLEAEPMRERGYHHPNSLHFLVEAMRVAYADRAEHLGDPGFTDVPVKELTDKAYAARRAKGIVPHKARRSTDVAPASAAALRGESDHTSHLIAVDKERNAVSLTFTVNYGWGSGVVVPGTGVLLNDEMDDFSVAPGVPNAYGLVGNEANSIAPAKVPLSSMSPTIVEKDKRFWFAAGSPGGSTIITTVLQIVIGVVDYDLDAGAAVAQPRLHHQWLPDSVRVEPRGFDPMTTKVLEGFGHTVQVREPWGNASCVLLRDDGVLEGAADPRGEGLAAGP